MSTDDGQRVVAAEYQSQEERLADLFGQIRQLDRECQRLRQVLAAPQDRVARWTDAALLLSEISKHVRHMSSVISDAGQSGHLAAESLRSGRADTGDREDRSRREDRRSSALWQACVRCASHRAELSAPVWLHALSLRIIAPVLVVVLVGLVILARNAGDRLPAGCPTRPIRPAVASSAHIVGCPLSTTERIVSRPPVPRVGTLLPRAGSPRLPHGMRPRIAASLPVLLLSPTTLQFGAQRVAVPSAERTIYVTNLGPSAVTVTHIAFGGRDRVDFDERDTCTGTTIAVEGDCVSAVGFLPTQPGQRTASLAIAADVGAPRTVVLQGDAQRESPPS